MRFVTVRELRNSAADVWESLDRDDVVLTSNGKPLGVIVRVEDGDLELTLANIRRARAAAALSRLRAQAAASGADAMTEAQIDAEIRASRRARRK